MQLFRSFLPALGVIALLPAFAPAAAAQKIGRDYFTDTRNGFRLRYPDDWTLIPVKPSSAELGVVGSLEGRVVTTKVGNQVMNAKPELLIFAFKDEYARPMTGASAKPGEEREKKRQTRADVVGYIGGLGLRGFSKGKPLEDEVKKVKKLEAHRRAWSATAAVDFVFDSWTFHLFDQDVCLLFVVPEQHFDKWEKTFEKSAKTFEVIEREASASLEASSSYDDLLAFHAEEASRTPGWRALPTPSKRFIVLTSSDKDRFVDDVVDRLERSRDLFEQEFPPEAPIEHVSVVRICDTEEEFHSYGNTPRGVAGWFNPSSKELVLFNATEIDKKVSFAVMTHEAFHQYCHFLFDQSEAHRWFDEGHGDYYGGADFGGRKTVIETRMPGGLDRLGILREMVRAKEWVPVMEHVSFDRNDWQKRGLRSYAQSWGIVFFLRQGMQGEVPRKCWKPAYADIIPNYMKVLHAGFRDAHAELLDEAAKQADEQGRELDGEVAGEIPDDKKEAIWRNAIQSSWGQIDMREFEEDWILFIEKFLKG